MTTTADDMIRVTLPDGSARELGAGATGAALAASIGPGLARAAVAIAVDGVVQDLGRPLPDGSTVSIITERDPDALARAPPLGGTHPGDGGA